MAEAEEKFERLVVAMLNPIVRLCLRRMVGIRALTALLKQAFVEVASKEIEARNEKVNVSRLSAMTGIHRKELAQIVKIERKPDTQVGLIARILGQWEQDSRFCNARQQPRPLLHDGERSEFKQLVLAVSSDLNPGTVLFELERMGLIERKGKNVHLKGKAALETKGFDSGLALLGNDSNDLASAVLENLDGASEIPHLHGRTEYDNLGAGDLPEVQRLLLEEGSKFHDRMRTILSQFDRDVNQKPSADRRARIAVVTFSFAQEDEG